MDLQILKFEKPPEVPQNFHFVGDGCVYGPDITRITCTTDYNRDQDLSVEMACDFPHRDHWLSYVIQESGFEAILEVWPWCSNQGFNIAAWLMEQGLAPRQRFQLDLQFGSSRDYWGEYDEWIDILDIQPVDVLTDREAATLWARYARSMGWEIKLDFLTRHR